MKQARRPAKDEREKSGPKAARRLSHGSKVPKARALPALDQRRDSSSHLARMLRLHELMAANRYPDCRKLADEFEVSPKTIQRDINFMRDRLGLPIDYDKVHSRFHYAEPVASFPVTAPALIEAVRRGFAFGELENLRSDFHMSLDAVAAQIGIPRATLRRRKIAGRFTAEESDRIFRFERLFAQAVETFGNNSDARTWLQTEQIGLGGAVPLEYAATEIGAREVENLLGRIEYGVYS